MVEYSEDAWLKYKKRAQERVEQKYERMQQQMAESVSFAQDADAQALKGFRQKLEAKIKKAQIAQYAYETEYLQNRFIRPRTEADMAYRLRQDKEFAKNVQNAMPPKMNLLFHGTPIYNAEKIIAARGLMSSVDRLGFETSMDGGGQVSVTTNKTLNVTVEGYADLNAAEGYLPAGCIFAMKAKTPNEGENLVTDNVDFNEPDRLYAVITTPENLNRVRGWMQNAGLDASRVHDFDGFVDMLKKENTRNNAMFATVMRNAQVQK